MLKNYLKVAVRNLLRYKTYSLINLAGLAVGMTCAFLILLYVNDELRYDRFHEKAERIYRIAWLDEHPQTRTPHPMAQALVKDLPEVENAVSLSPMWGAGLTRRIFSVRYGDKRFDEQNVFSVDTTFFKVFSFPLLKGDPRTALQEPFAIILSERMAQKYFGAEEALGKVLRLNNEVDLKVAGVLQNVPTQSHFHFDFLISYALLKPRETGSYYTWADFGHYNYILLKPGADPQTVEAKIPSWIGKYLELSEAELAELRAGPSRFALQPLTDIHLRSHLAWELEPNGDTAYVYLFTAVAVFILLIAGINFMNLATARSATRAKEVGVRKVLGAARAQLVGQFMGEALWLSLGALALAIASVELLLPLFNAVSGRALTIHYLEQPRLFFGMCGLALLVGIFSGGYPAFFLSAYQPAKVLKGETAAGNRSTRFRRALVVTQFTLSIALIIGALLVSAQLDFLRSHKLGFAQERILVLRLKHQPMREQYESVKAELLRRPEVLRASAVSNVPGGRFNSNPIQWRPAEEDAGVMQTRVDHDFFATLDIPLAEGRAFQKESTTDADSAFILNETAAKLFDWDTAVGKRITWFDDDDTRRGTVIGVAKDFHFQSLHTRIQPLLISLTRRSFNYMLVKVGPNDLPGTLAHCEAVWKKFDPEFDFEYSFLDADFDRLYRAEGRVQTLFGYFTFLAVFIACLGLFGLASFTTQQRRKEIGVRKVLGASVAGVVGMLSKDFVKLVLLANVLAWPLAYFAMSRWLRDFAYRIDIGFGIFMFAGGLALLIALLTVSAQALKAALTNPVEALRYE